MPTISGLNDAGHTSHKAAPSRASALHGELETNSQYHGIFSQPGSLTAPGRATSLHE
jgi:hypothetical protein